MNTRARAQLWLEFITDFACQSLAYVISFLIFRYAIPRIGEYPLGDWYSFFALFLLSFVIIYITFHNKIDIYQRSRVSEMYSVIKNSTLTYMLLIVICVLLKNKILDSRYLLVSSYVLSIVFSTISRYFLKRWITGFFTQSKIASIVGIITTSDYAENFVEGINKDWTKRISGIVLLDKYCDEDNVYHNFASTEANDDITVSATEINDVPVISQDDSFLDWIRSAPLDEVYINLPYKDVSEIQSLVEELEDMGITVHINVPMLKKIIDDSKFSNINLKMNYGAPMATFAASEMESKFIIAKRIIDVITGLIGTILSIPIIAVVAIPLLIESPGPLIFKQNRVGKNGRIFKIYKLRSMYADAEERKKALEESNKMNGLMFKMDDDPRITKVGKFIRKYSIDELPQFWNVVKGDMSLIGTRPPTVDEFEQYESQHKRRLSMRPGITGMWQVSGRSDIQDFEDVVKLDCEYIDTWSPMLDTKIFFKTIVVVLTHKGAE